MMTHDRDIITCHTKVSVYLWRPRQFWNLTVSTYTSKADINNYYLCIACRVSYFYEMAMAYANYTKVERCHDFDTLSIWKHTLDFWGFWSPQYCWNVPCSWQYLQRKGHNVAQQSYEDFLVTGNCKGRMIHMQFRLQLLFFHFRKPSCAILLSCTRRCWLQMGLNICIRT